MCFLYIWFKSTQHIVKKAYLFFLIAPIFLLAQNKHVARQHQEVLSKGNVGKEFVFGNIDTDGSALHLIYIGTFTTEKGEKFKILTSVWYWGHATSRILIFTSTNTYYGQYYLGSTCDLPYAIKNNVLLFKKNDDCDCTDLASINLEKGIPLSFFKPCKGGIGDIFSFTKEETY